MCERSNWDERNTIIFNRSRKNTTCGWQSRVQRKPWSQRCPAPTIDISIFRLFFFSFLFFFSVRGLEKNVVSNILPPRSSFGPGNNHWLPTQSCWPKNLRHHTIAFTSVLREIVEFYFLSPSWGKCFMEYNHACHCVTPPPHTHTHWVLSISRIGHYGFYWELWGCLLAHVVHVYVPNHIPMLLLKFSMARRVLAIAIVLMYSSWYICYSCLNSPLVFL